MIDRPIILASKSPRRKQLLEAAGFQFTIKTKSIAETYPADMPVTAVASYLAQLKAQAAKDFIQTNEILLTADSIVVLDNTIFGKPKDYADAFQTLQRLSGRTHQVITGVCLLSKEKEVIFSDTATVYFNKLTDAEIHYYITHYAPYDKAGAYAIQEWIGFTKVAKIDGTYSTIMGLPVNRVYEELMRF